MSVCCGFDIEFISDDAFDLGFDSSDDAFDLGFEEVIDKYQKYSGDYVFTPTNETQTVETEGLVVLENIIINPIPSNYGLITWNGSVITVS